jgi:hypothetical protein
MRAHKRPCIVSTVMLVLIMVFLSCTYLFCFLNAASDCTGWALSKSSIAINGGTFAAPNIH